MQMCSHVMEHATRSDRDGTFVCRPASTRSSGSRGRAVVQNGLQHRDHVGLKRRSPTTQCQSKRLKLTLVVPQVNSSLVEYGILLTVRWEMEFVVA